MIEVMPKATLDLNDRLVKSPSSTDFAYAAGIMDGEGYFCATSKSNSFGLRVAMTDREVVDWLHETFGGNLYASGRTSTGNTVYVWYLQRQADLRFVIDGMLPYMRLKAPRAKAMLSLLDHLALTPTYDIPTREVTQTERDRRRALRAEWRNRGLELRRACAASNFYVGVRKV